MYCRSVVLLLSLCAAALARVQIEARELQVYELTELQRQEFVALLNALPEESIQSALEKNLEQYKIGVFNEDRKAIEKVHNDDPPLATRLISDAALEALRVSLAKRQDVLNTTVTSPTPEETPPPTPEETPPPTPTPTPTPPPTEQPPPESEPPPESPAPPSSLPSVEIPIEVSTTDSAGGGVIVTSSYYDTPTAVVEVPIVTTDDQGNTFTTSVLRPGVVLTQTDADGAQVLITSAVPSARRTATRTDSRGSTFITDIIPGDGGASSMVVYVTTLPDGQVRTITTYEYVGGTATGTGDGNGSPDATNTRPDPGVQTAAANIISWPWLAEAVALLACAAVFTFFL